MTRTSLGMRRVHFGRMSPNPKLLPRGKAAAKVAAASDSTAGRRQAAASRVTGLNEEELSALPDDLQACARQLAYIPDAFKNLSPEKILDGQMLGRSVVSVGSCQTQDLDLAAVICYLSS